MSISIQSRVIQTEQGVSLSGDFVFANIIELENQGNHCLENKKDNSSIVFDCKEMQRLDSAGIALLVSWKRQSKQDNKDCRFESLPQQAQTLIEAYHLQSLLND